MQRFKLPSGRIIDLDAITMIRPVQVYATGKSCSLIVDGCATEVGNGDADVLYQAVEALVCNPTPVADKTPASAYRIVDSTAQLADVLAQVAKVRDGLHSEVLEFIKRELTRILSEAGWDAMPPKADSEPHGNVDGRYSDAEALILNRVCAAYMQAKAGSTTEAMLNQIMIDYGYKGEVQS